MKKQPFTPIFTEEEIDAIKYVLYHTNAGGHAANPPHPSWYNAANDPNNKNRYKKMVKENKI